MVEGVAKIIEIDSHIASAGMAAGMGGMLGGGESPSKSIFPSEPKKGMDSNTATFEALKSFRGKRIPPPPKR